MIFLDHPAAPEQEHGSSAADRRADHSRPDLWRCGDLLVRGGLYAGGDHRCLPGVEFIKKNMKPGQGGSRYRGFKTVVRICTQYAQKGMWNIFIAILLMTLAFALLNPNFFVAYLISIACFGLFEAIYMANAGRRVGQREENCRSRSEGKGFGAPRRNGHR